MLKKVLFLAIVYVFVLCGWSFGVVDVKKIHNIEPAKKTIPADIKIIVIDPGHGGKDCGAIGSTGLREKDINLDVAKRLKKYLEDNGFLVYMTRDSDKFVSLQARADFVNKLNGDLFISVHTNASRNRIARGLETFYLSDPMNDSFDPDNSAGEGYVKYENLNPESSEINKIFLRLLDSASSQDRSLSIGLADNIHKELRRFIRVRDRGVKRARFFVLRSTTIPAVLIEVGFLSNPKEQARLSKSFYRNNIAKGITHGIIRFRNMMVGLSNAVGLKRSEENQNNHNKTD